MRHFRNLGPNVGSTRPLLPLRYEHWPPCGGNDNHYQFASSMRVHRAPVACISLRRSTDVSVNTGALAVKATARSRRSTPARAA